MRVIIVMSTMMSSTMSIVMLMSSMTSTFLTLNLLNIILLLIFTNPSIPKNPSSVEGNFSSSMFTSKSSLIGQECIDPFGKLIN